MLNRRHLRIKVLQTLYAFFQSGNDSLQKGEQELNTSIEKVYDLYILLLLLIPEAVAFLDQEQEVHKTKHLPTAEDLKPNKKLAQNPIAQHLTQHKPLASFANNRHLSWRGEQELIKKMVRSLQADPVYTAYLKEDGGFEADRNIINQLFLEHIASNEYLVSQFEERNIYWHDDYEMVTHAVVKTIEAIKPGQNADVALQPLFKDELDDRKFITDLFRKTILNSEEYATRIGAKTENWEVDRIALMDIIIMKMALAEMLWFSEIPLKVSLNEYIEISKQYSTPKSKLFINGILDKLVADLKAENRIRKVGRGLIE